MMMNSPFYDAITDLDDDQTIDKILQNDQQEFHHQSQLIAFYHPNIDRERAEYYLRSQYDVYRSNGLFLLRECTTSKDDFSLSLIFNDKCYHYKIQWIYDIYFSIDSGPQLAGLDSLVRYYQQRADGLICVLSKEFVRGQAPPLHLRCFGSTNLLHRATQQSNLELIRKILSRVDINSKDENGSTALHYASSAGQDDIVRFLIKSGVQVSQRDAQGSTALHRAAAANRSSTLFILIHEALIDIEERNYSNNWVPLHNAAFANASSCIQILLDCGAPLRPRTDQGKTPIELAEENHCDEAKTLLRQYQISSARSNRLDWFHDDSTFDRYAAKHLIENVPGGPSNGMFLVRHSSKNLKNFALTLYFNNEIFNFEIIFVNDQTLFVEDGPYFSTLEHLIDHYCRIPDGLPTVLIYGVSPTSKIKWCRLKKTPELSSRRLPLTSSLNSSITSLSSCLSSPSATSSNHESPLSTSSSSTSLASNQSPKKSQIDENLLVLSRKSSIERISYRLNFISPSQIEKTAKLGEGEFGEVYRGFYRETSTKSIPVAIKHLKDYSYAAKIDFLREAEHMSKLNHRCICKLYGIVDSTGNDMMMIIELLLLGSMLDYLGKYKTTIPKHRLRLWASQIADGMSYMEHKDIVHRDLASRNILLESIDQVKIGDFGLSRCITTDVYVQQSDSKIPVKWYSPEAISLGKFTSKSDVWSFGITLWEMFSFGETPYGEMSGSDVYYALKHGQRLERPIHCPLFIYQIMLNCWQWDEKKRPNFDQLYQSLKIDRSPFLFQQQQQRKSTSTDRDDSPSDHF